MCSGGMIYMSRDAVFARRLPLPRRARWLVAPMVAAVGLSACSVSYTEKAPKSCSPSYSISHPQGGRISVQQTGRGSSVQWGLFTAPKYKVGSRFDVEIYLGGGKKSVDSADRSHGRRPSPQLRYRALARHPVRAARRHLRRPLLDRAVRRVARPRLLGRAAGPHPHRRRDLLVRRSARSAGMVRLSLQRRPARLVKVATRRQNISATSSRALVCAACTSAATNAVYLSGP